MAWHVHPCKLCLKDDSAMSQVLTFRSDGSWQSRPRFSSSRLTTSLRHPPAKGDSQQL